MDSLPGELYLWQCDGCQRVLDRYEDVQPRTSGRGKGRHLKPGKNPAPRSPWCTGVPRRFTYRLAT